MAWTFTNAVKHGVVAVTVNATDGTDTKSWRYGYPMYDGQTAAQFLQRACNIILPRGRSVRVDVNAGRCVEHGGAVDKRQQVHDRLAGRQPAPKERGGPFSDRPVQLAQDRERTQRKACVVQIAVALSPRKTAVGPLEPFEEVGVSETHRLRQFGGSYGQSDRQLFQVTWHCEMNPTLPQARLSSRLIVSRFPGPECLLPFMEKMK